MIKSGFIIAFFYLVIGIYTLPHYGVDWDTVNHLSRGQAYLHYFLTGEISYKSLPEFKEYSQKDNSLLFAPDKPKETLPRRSFYQLDGYTAEYYLKNDSGHPPLSGIISSFFNFLFFQKLGIINDIDSYHLYPILLASILTGIIFWWSKKTYGTLAGLVALLSLTLYPLFLGESHFNIKDVPETFFYSLTIIILYEGFIKKSNFLIILSAISFGLALATKFNILFLLLTFIIWGIIFFLSSKKSILRYLSIIPSIIFSPIIVVVIFFISWPFLWRSPIENFIKIVNYYKTMGINSNFDPRFIHFGFNTYALQWIVYTTPLVILLFFIFGVFYSLTKGFKERRKTSIFVLLWFLVPIIRVSLSNAGIYGGVRQIMEFIPAMVILSGIGASYIVSLLHLFIVKHKKEVSIKVIEQLNNRTIKIALQLLVILSFIPITLKLISIHPNENVYFNPLIGGLKGAKERNFPYWGFSFGNAYRQGIEWINSNAEKEAKLVLDQGLMPNLPDILVRNDVDYANIQRSGYLKKGEYVIGLDYGSDLKFSYYSSRYYHRFLNPIYQVQVDDVNIMNIWKNTLENTKDNYLQEEKKTNIKYAKTEKGIILDLEKVYILSRIEWSFFESNCQPEEQAYFEVSLEGNTWLKIPHSLQELPIPSLGTQPQNGKITFPMAAEPTRYIYIAITPRNACIKNINDISIYYLPNVLRN